MSPTISAPKLKEAVFSWWALWIYWIFTVKNTGLPIREVEANTLVDSSCVDWGVMAFKFQVEGPKILMESDWGTSDTAKSVIEFGTLVPELEIATLLLLLIVNLRSWILPAVIWIRELESLVDCKLDKDLGLVPVLILFVLLLVLEEDWGKVIVAADVDDEDEDKEEGDILRPDWGDEGIVWRPINWFEVFLLPFASLYDMPRFKVCTVPAAEILG